LTFDNGKTCNQIFVRGDGFTQCPNSVHVDTKYSIQLNLNAQRAHDLFLKV